MILLDIEKNDVLPYGEYYISYGHPDSSTRMEVYQFNLKDPCEHGKVSAFPVQWTADILATPTTATVPVFSGFTLEFNDPSIFYSDYIFD